MNVAELAGIISRVNYRDWVFTWEPVHDGVLAYARFDAPEAPHGRWNTEQQTRQWYIPCDASESEVVRTCLLLVLTAEEHEAREWFHYKGKQVYSPHTSVMEKANG